MLGSEYPCPGAPSDVILENKVASVEVALRTDPDVISNDTSTVEATLDVRLGPDEDRVADLKRLDVLEAHGGPYLHPVSELFGGCAPDGPSQHLVEWPIAVEPRVQLDQAAELVGPSEVRGKTQLKVRVGFS